MNKYRLYIFVVLATTIFSSINILAKPVRVGQVEAELIAENVSIQPGLPFWVALRLKMDEGWHINWLNPGDFGLAPTITWQLPDGFQAGKIEWPTPQRLPFSPFVGYGYEGEIILPVKIRPPDALKSDGEISIEAACDWVVCGEVCVPGASKLSLAMSVGDNSPLQDKKWAALFEISRKSMPAADSSSEYSAAVGKSSVVITIASPNTQSKQIESMIFFPEFNGLIKNAATQNLTKDGRNYVLEIARDPMGVTPPERLKGILVSRGKAQSGFVKKNTFIDVPLQKK